MKWIAPMVALMTMVAGCTPHPRRAPTRSPQAAYVEGFLDGYRRAGPEGGGEAGAYIDWVRIDQARATRDGRHYSNGWEAGYRLGQEDELQRD